MITLDSPYMKNYTVLMLVVFSFVGGYTMTNIYAQETDTSFAGVSTGLIVAIIALVTTGLTVVKTLADKGIIDKKIGSAAVMAADAAVAVKDSRELIKEGLQAGFDIVKTTSPEAAQKIEQTTVPIMQKVQQRVDEYTPKVQSFANIAAKLSTKTTSEIKDIKEEIPNEIVPS